MLRLPKFITKTLSVRLSLQVVSAMALLLMVTLVVMLHYSRKAVKEEALLKATQTLDGTILCVDNILLTVEQSTGNIYFNLIPRLSRPDLMQTFCSKLLESNPLLTHCAIAFEPDFFKDRKYFMAYADRDAAGEVVSGIASFSQADSLNGNLYTEQVWYSHGMTSLMPTWLTLHEKMDEGKEPIITFCLPLPGYNGKPVGVLATDLLLKPFSQAVHEIKPSPNSYCTLLANDGTYIVHPDSSKLLHQTVFTATECHSSSRKAAEAIMSGDTDYKPFSLNGKDYLVFYKPFSRVGLRGRATDNLGWKAGIIYPEADIFGDYNSLLYYVLAIAIVGIILLFVLSRAFIHRQLIPLRLLTASAQRIAQGNYDELIPDSQQQDEIGRLQNHFLQMQQSLALQVGEYEQLTATLKKRGEDLRVAYEKAQLADRLKTAFLHNMTDQMADPAGIIEDHVNTLCENKCSISEEDANKLTDDILLQGETITELLNHLLHVSEEETGKEVAHA